jgi:dinuclear metal center YbgI/SA1388 family protein
VGTQVELESVIGFLDTLLGVEGFPDYKGAVNGLQVAGPGPVRQVAVAVDAAEYTVEAAVESGADLLVVHHGLFWGGAAPVTGRTYRRLSALIRGEVAVYSAHLPLDAHPEVGNCAELARALALEPEERFGQYEGRDIGFAVRLDESRAELQERVAQLLGGPVQLLAGGPDRVQRMGIVTGGGGSFIPAAAQAGLDTLLTGESSHHGYVDAREFGVNVLLGGHYRTETWGVKALGRVLAAEFGLPWEFLDHPSGL